MKTFIVNLKRSSDRREYMKKLLKDFPYEWEFFEAVDGLKIKNLSEVYSEKDALRILKRTLKRGEVGCALSHLGIYRKMIDENIDKALILEDDIILQKDFYAVLESLKDIKLNNDIILLGQSDRKPIKKIAKKHILDNYILRQMIFSGCGTYGYIIDFRAAKKLLYLNFPVKAPADWWSGFFRFINIYLLEPEIVYSSTDNEKSIIDTMDNRINRTFIDEIKANCTIFNFIKVFFNRVFSYITLFIRFVYQVLPEQRIE